ncbi:MAG: hypothetical protein JWO38_429 [Gemmataceae bacterium]|nr:hypothetical protein [Gemmataceae bacterium]
MSMSWVRRLFRRPSRTDRRAARPAPSRLALAFRPGVEGLEQRDVPAFLAPVSYPIGTSPAGIAVGDFNGDGRDDMAVVNQAVAGTVTILPGNADGTFQPGVSYAAGTSPVAATAGDLNGDGKLDLVVVGAGVTVLLGNGDGTFGAPTTYAAGLVSHSVKVGDFNTDGKLDVATMSANFANLLPGNGDGTLQNATSISVPGNNINLVVGDYNHDGNLDMATSNTVSTGTISVVKGHGDGTFDPAVSYDAFSAPVYLAEGDFNHDGYEDFVVPNSYVQTSASVILSDGHGGYQAPHTYGIAETGFDVEVGDFNHDGNLDFEIRGGNEIMVHLGKGDGTFFPEVDYQTPGGRNQMGAAGDFNGDGATDLAYPNLTGGVTVLQNDNADAQNLAGAVTFRVTAPATTTSGSVLPMTITAVDASGTIATGFRGTVFLGSSDPAATTAEGYAFNPLDAGIPYAFTAADAGSHTFTGAIRLVTGGPQTVTVSAPNLTPASATVTVTGQVTRLAFSAPTAVNAGDTFAVTVSAIDTQGSVAPGYTSTVHFTSSDVQAGLPADYTFTPADAGSHTFTLTLKTSGSQSIGAREVGGTIGGGASVAVTPGAVQSFALAVGSGPIGVARPVTVVARDVFGNVATGYTGTVTVTSSDPAAVLPPDTPLVNGVATVNVKLMTVGTQTITATDVTNPALTGTVSSDATPPVPALFAVSGYPGTAAGVANTFTVTVRDTIGQVATGYTGTVFFSSSDVQAGLPASYTFTAADAGAHTFTATFRTAGTQSLAARAAAGLTGTETGITVTPAAFSSFRVSTAIANPEGMRVTADAVIPFTVRAVDVFGNSVTGHAGTVTFSSPDPLATFPAAYTFAAADAGTHTFTVGLHTATKPGASWSVSVADVSNPATLATIPGFEVVNGAATTFGITLPTQITAGVAFSSKVTVSDAWGNGVQNYFGTVHFGTSAALAGLPADYTFTGADAGVHGFTLALDTSGTQTLSVTDTGNPLLTASASGTVKSAAVSTLAVAFPATTAAGVAPPLTVTAVDAFGNVAAGYTGTVVFGSSDVQAGLPASYSFTTQDAGSHTFNVALKTAGTQSITVTANAAITATQAGIAVTASAAAGAFVVAGFPATTAGVAQTFTVTVKDPYGNFATGYTGTVTFGSSDVQAGLPASYTFTAVDAGVRTFTATLKTAGTQSITVKDAANATAAGRQTGIAVSAAATAASITVSGFPATAAGVGHTFTVTARDAFGNICPAYTGTVTFGSSDVQAGLPASYTFTAADAGAHSFTATLKTAGAQSITARDAATALAGSETGIAVSAGAAARFSISTPGSVTQGVGFKFTLTVLDAYGNVVTGYRGKVHLSSTDSKGGTQDYTFSNSDNGVHVFSYTFNTLGFQTLTIVDTTTSAVVGRATVNVVPK